LAETRRPSFYILWNLLAFIESDEWGEEALVSQTELYDAIVVGSGQAGTPLCRALAEAGMRTALVEREHVGGTCVNEGCTPTKTMVASARVAYLARRGANYGVQTGPIIIDLKRVRERKREIVKRFREGSQNRIEKTPNLDLIFGTASFTGPKTLLVRGKDGGERSLSAERIFINAGTRAANPKLEGLDGVPFLDNASIMELETAPEHLLILGGGYIGLEFGQIFRRFGSRVTIVQSAKQLLAREDADVAEEVAKILREDGIEVLLSAKSERVSSANGRIRLDVSVDSQACTIEGSHLLVAIGRTPNSDALNLAAAGMEADTKGFIKTNNRLETNVAGVYALGDIKGGPAFTHISYDDFRIIRANVIEKKNVTIDGRLVPYTCFIDPQLGHVGLSEEDARRQGRKVRVAKMPMNYVARALEMDESRGFMKAIVDADTDQILGATVLGIEGGEVMAVFEVAIMGKLPYTALRDGIFAHPTLAEGLNNLFASWV
jgi:pyruvate/2-oxoglutarate dehydrogenase complex dihydrolipoamide dehydrogenase (E3) component